MYFVAKDDWRHSPEYWGQSSATDSNTENSPHHLFVFFDGTNNGESSKTNVWRLYKLAEKSNLPKSSAIYIEGVGRLTDFLFGRALGTGMETRMKSGYSFLADNHRNEQDHIYIFGFSRGALQARHLAGLISYAGLPNLRHTSWPAKKAKLNRIFEEVKKVADEDYKTHWDKWSPSELPPLAADIKTETGLTMRNAPVKFVGVWDTVPGSAFKNYWKCKEAPDNKPGDRYKIDSYPSIANILHAVSIDEKRSKFKMVNICDPINRLHTDASTRWFPGAHADIGGGYKNPEGKPELELPSISLAWMIDRFEAATELKLDNVAKQTIRNAANPLGTAHWSVWDWPNNLGSSCIDRMLPDDEKKIDPSFDCRSDRSSACVVTFQGQIFDDKKPKNLKYPLKCEDMIGNPIIKKVDCISKYSAILDCTAKQNEPRN